MNPLSDPNTTRIKIELLVDGNLVFAATIEQQTITDLDSYRLKRVTEFIEGDWIEDLRDLKREMKQVAKRNLRLIRRARGKKDVANFGLSTTNQSGSGLSTLKKIWRKIDSSRH